MPGVFNWAAVASYELLVGINESGMFNHDFNLGNLPILISNPSAIAVA